jgi:hypothetical protein
MPDPWLTEKELKKHQEEVEKHPLTKEAEEAKKAADKDAEKLHKQQEENRKKVEEGELVEVRANGAVVGYRNAEDVPEEELAFGGSGTTGIKPKEEGRGGNPEDNEIGPAGDKIPEEPHGNVNSTEPSVEDVKKAEEKSAKRAEKRDANKGDNKDAKGDNK